VSMTPRTYLEMVWRSEVDRALDAMRVVEGNVFDYRPGTPFHKLWASVLSQYLKFLHALDAVRDAANIPEYEPLRARLRRYPSEKAA
jgi:hypothetical protein